jgi:lysophospholipase L1-like esterase
MRLRLVLLLLAGLAAAAGLLATRQPTQTWYQRTRLAEQLAAESAAPEGAVVLLGDSIIEELDATAVASGALNFGTSGDTSRDLLDRVGRYRSLAKARAVFLEIGINDLVHPTGDDVVANYRRILAALPREPRLYLIGLLPIDEQALLPGYGTLASNAEIARLDAAVVELCRARDNCVPLQPFGAGPLRADYQRGDGLHLSAAGNRVLAGAMKAALAEP